MYAFWRWPIWAKTCIGGDINYLTYVTLNSTLIKIIINTSVTVKMSHIKKTWFQVTRGSALLKMCFILCYEIYVEDRWNKCKIMKYRLEEQDMHGR
jgi:hypothetical protein